MRILGIDPGVATIGFGLVEAERNQYRLIRCGVITTPAHTSLASRLDQIYHDLSELLDAFKPDAVSFCWPVSRPAYRSTNTRRSRSSRRSLDTAVRRKSRSWTWFAASAI